MNKIKLLQGESLSDLERKINNWVKPDLNPSKINVLNTSLLKSDCYYSISIVYNEVNDNNLNENVSL